MAEDKRIRRTKKLLREALCETMRKKRFQNITVSDIVRQADINRGTFYTYYKDVCDLREHVEDDMIESLREIIKRTLPDTYRNSMKSSIRQVVSYLQENHNLAYVLLNDGELEKKMRFLLTDCCKIQMSKHSTIDEWTLCFITSGCIGIMKHWMMQPENIDKEKVIDRMDTLFIRVLS